MKNRKNLFFGTFIFVIILCGQSSFAQENSFADALFENYEEFQEESLDQRRFKHSDLKTLFQEYKDDPQLRVRKVGESIEGRSLNLLSIGEGETEVLLWSQMHGDESTATMALFDIFNFFQAEGFEEEKRKMLNNLTIHFLPMLNPDGAESFQRRNALGIDVNRDALRLQSPEAQTLKKIRDSLDADFGFNLHDQSKYYSAGGTNKPATISFLAPAYNYEKSVNEVRGNAMKLIVSMNEVLQEYIPGQVAKYNDDFEPRAFGDNIQKWGTSTVLIESGGYPGDPEKQKIRKFNFVAILSALHSIATGEFKNESIEAYKEIPENDRMLFDLKLSGLKYELLGEEYILDLGINRSENDFNKHKNFYYVGRIADQGDLSTSHAYENFDASGYELKFGRIYPETFQDTSALKKLNFSSLLKEGYSYIRLKHLPKDKSFTDYPINLVGENFTVPEKLEPGAPATFFLEKNGQIEHAVINGFLLKPEDLQKIENALILKQ